MMSHSVTFHSVYFELSTVPKRDLKGKPLKGVDLTVLVSLYMASNLISKQKLATNRNKSQKIAINRNKIDLMDCDFKFFPNEKIDLNGSILVGTFGMNVMF